MKHFLTFIFLFIGTAVLACDCKSIRDLKAEQKKEFESSDLIFIGVAVESKTDGTHVLKIIELLKGENTKKTIEVSTESYCIVVPRIEDGYYLIYSNRNEDETITISECSLSRSFDFPYLSGEESGVYPPPPRFSDDPTMAMIEYEKTRIEFKKRALGVLMDEIYELRRKRDK